jgi:hypothetical protein
LNVWFLLIAGLVLILAAGGMLWFGRRTQRRVNLLRAAVPTQASELKNLFPGELVCVTGVARAEWEFLSEHSRTPCIYYTSKTVREYERTEQTQGSRNSPGQTTRRRMSETISSNGGYIPFSVEDDSGRALVIPDGADFDARETMNRFEPYSRSGNGFSLGRLAESFGGDRTLGYRYTESLIPADVQVLVVGVVNEHGCIVRPDPSRKNAGFIISYRTQDALRSAWQSTAQRLAYGSIVAVIVGVVLVLWAAVLAIF